MSSRLFQEVREERGLAYSIYAVPLALLRLPACSASSAGTAPEDVGELIAVALDCLRQAAEDVDARPRSRAPRRR